MTQITVDISKKYDKMLKVLIAEKEISSKAVAISRIVECWFDKNMKFET